MADFDRSKLPKRVQSHIDRLEKDVEWYRQQVEQQAGAVAAVQPEPGAIIVGLADLHQYALPPGSQVRFYLASGSVDVSIDDQGKLEIHGSERLVLAPRASNAVAARVER